MRTPRINVYTKLKDYKRRFLIKIDKHLRKEFKTRKSYRRARRELRLGLPNGLGNYSRKLNRIFISLETITNDLTCNSRYKKNFVDRFTRTFALVTEHEFLHYCFNEEELKSGITINPEMTHDTIRYMTRYTLDELRKEIFNYYLVEQDKIMKRARKRTVGRVRIRR